MPEDRDQPMPWHTLWVKIVLLAYDKGCETADAVAQADYAVAEYRDRLVRGRNWATPTADHKSQD